MGRAPTGNERTASGGCVIATPITTHPASSAPQTCIGAHTRVRKRPARPPHPGVSPGCRKKGQFRSPSLGLTGVLAATRRRLSPASVRDLGPPDLPRVLRPDYCRIAFQQPVASSTAQFAWLGPPSPKVITRIVPGTRVRRLLVLLARPLAGSGAAVPHVFKILLWFAGTCFPTIVVYSCCCCCCCRRRRRHRAGPYGPHGNRGNGWACS